MAAAAVLVALVATAAPASAAGPYAIATAAGTIGGFAGDGGPATAAQLNVPIAVAAGPGGGFLIADFSNARVRRVGPDGVITTVAGTGVVGNSGDGGPATAAQLTTPRGVA